MITTEHFTDKRIDDVVSGEFPLTADEREFLLTDTPHFEECVYTRDELAAMGDPGLMNAAYWTWADYSR